MAKEMKVIYEEVNSFKSFLDFCCKRANNGENNFFMRKGENGPVHITYNEFREACTRFAAGLLKAGITNKHVAIISENSYEYYVMYFGTVMAGNAFIPLNLTLEEDKLSGLINFADTDIIMISEKYENFREVIENDCPNVKTFISINAQKENELSYDGLIASVTAEEALATEFKDSVYNDETSLLCFTSGTSGGIPKVVMLSVKNILANVRYGSHDIYGEWYPLRLLPLPLYHLAALNFPIYTFMPQSTEMALCTEVKDVFADLYYYKPGYLMAVPAMSEMILKLLEAEVDKMGKREEFEQYNKEADEAGIPPFERRHYAEQFKGIVGGNLVSLTFAGAKSSETIKAALGRFGMFTRDGYGMTECAPMVATEYDECRLGSVGQVCRFNEVKIIDGVAYVKGDNVMKGYYKNPEGTKQVLNEDGWFCTGDLARLDKDGEFLYILGRAKSVIVLTNGENIDPEEIEGVLTKSEYIKEALIVPDEKSKNTVVGALIYPDEDAIAKDGRDAQTIIAEVVAAVNKSLPIAKRMARFRIMDKPFEKNSMMKVLRLKYPNMEA